MVTFSIFVNNTPVTYTCVALSILGIGLLARRLCKQKKRKTSCMLNNVSNDPLLLLASKKLTDPSTQNEELNIDDVLVDEPSTSSSNQLVAQIDFATPTSVTDVTDIANTTNITDTTDTIDMSHARVASVPLRRSSRLAQRQAANVQSTNSSDVGSISENKRTKIE